MSAVTDSEKTFLAITEKLQAGESVSLKPQGTSMFPLLWGGRDTVVVSPLGERNPRRNDIILYRRDNGLLVLHRLCHARKEGYYFVGDNQTELEGPLDRKQLLAYATQMTRRGRTFSVRHPLYLLASRIWLRLRPIRPLFSRSAKKLLVMLHLWKD